jgi:tRNA uridine 5-carboxymethylaminomethyl modification enzyme
MMCHVTYTNPKTHRIVQRGLKQSALYGGAIKGTGVRYCPSIEDKVVKFAERERHMVFIEPEGPDTVEAYPNGVSTSLPVDLQLRMLRSIQGMEHCLMLRPGYAIEHDFVQPTELFRTLETRSCRNLFFAGQINGTTGYEEAGAQGLVAGVNAALRVKGKQGFELTRADAYVGVMIDDLVSKGTDEPYRMFTSRVEYRLLLREDNADLRLGAPGRRLGLLPAAKYRAVQDKQKQFNAAIQWLNRERVKPTRAVNARLRRLGTVSLKQSVPAIDLLRRPEVEWVDLCTMTESAPELGVWARQLVEVEVKYAGYIERAQKQLARFQELESIRVPAGIDFRKVAGLSTEIREKLAKAKPKTLAQAESIAGVTPAAVFALLVHLKAKK